MRKPTLVDLVAAVPREQILTVVMALTARLLAEPEPAAPPPPPAEDSAITTQ